MFPSAELKRIPSAPDIYISDDFRQAPDKVTNTASDTRKKLLEILEEEAHELGVACASKPADDLTTYARFATFDRILSESAELLLSRQFVNLRAYLQAEQKVRQLLWAPQPDFEQLYDSVQNTHYTVAYTVMGDYLKQAPISDEHNAHIQWLVPLLTPKQRAAYFESFLKRSIGLDYAHDKRGYYAFYTVTDWALADKMLDVLQRSAKLICETKNIAEVAYKLSIPGKSIYEAFTAARTDTDDIGVVQALISLQHKTHFIALASLLEKSTIRERFMQCMTAIITSPSTHMKPRNKKVSEIPDTTSTKAKIQKKKTVSKPYWQQVSEQFLWHVFNESTFEKSREALCHDIALVCEKNRAAVQSFCESADTDWLHALLVSIELQSVVNKKENGRSYIKRCKDIMPLFCSLRMESLSTEWRSYVETLLGPLYTTIHENQDAKANVKLLKAMLPMKLDEPFKTILRKELFGSRLPEEKYLALLDENHEQLSASLCYEIAIFCAIKEKNDIAHTWFTHAACKGHEDSLVAYLDKELQNKKPVDVRRTIYDVINKACTINPSSLLNRALRDLLYIEAIGNNYNTLPPHIDVKHFCSNFLAKNPTDTYTKDNPTLFLCQAFNWAYCTIIQHQNGSEALHNATMGLLRTAYTIYMEDTTIGLNPIRATPIPVVEYLESIIKNATQSALQESREHVALATLLLRDLGEIDKYTNTKVIEAGIQYAFNSANTITINNKWVIDDNLCSLQHQLLLLAANQASLESFIKNSANFPKMNFKSDVSESHELVTFFKASQLGEQLYNLTMPETPGLWRLRIHINAYKDSTAKTEDFKNLCKYYESIHDDKQLQETRNALKQHLQLAVAKQVTSNPSAGSAHESHVALLNKLKSINPLTSDIRSEQEILREKKELQDELKALRAEKHSIDAINYALQADICAIIDGECATIYLEQARQVNIQTINKPWMRFVTRTLCDFMWQKASDTNIPSDQNNTQGHYSDRAYACLLNESSKAQVARKALLKPGILKNAFCSLLYARCLLDDGKKSIYETSDWSQRLEVYKLLKHAIMQGQREYQTAQSLDKASQYEAFTILNACMLIADLGAAIVRASVESDPVAQAHLIAEAPCHLDKKRAKLENQNINNFLALAQEHGVITQLKNLCDNRNHRAIATAALQRIEGHQGRKV